MYEIDKKIKILDKVQKDKIIYGDFMGILSNKIYKKHIKQLCVTHPM